jgi:hypothetical protein
VRARRAATCALRCPRGAAPGQSAHEADRRHRFGSLGSTTSLSQVKNQLTSAFQQLATSYEKTFAKVDCSKT